MSYGGDLNCAFCCNDELADPIRTRKGQVRVVDAAVGAFTAHCEKPIETISQIVPERSFFTWTDRARR